MRMQSIAIHSVPLFPNTNVLANRSIATAGYVAQDAVEKESGGPGLSF
jgi:hypothetical protein